MLTRKQFSLRCLLLVVTFSCIGFGYLGNLRLTRQKQESAIEHLRRDGVLSVGRGHRGELVRIHGDKLMSTHVRLLPCLREVNWVELEDIQDDALGNVGFLPSVKHLEMNQIQNSTVGIAAIERLEQRRCIRSLQLSTPHLPRLMPIIGGLRTIEELSLHSPEKCDVDFSHLKNLPNLRVLTVGGIHVSQECLAILFDLPKLQELNLGEEVRLESLRNLSNSSIVCLRLRLGNDVRQLAILNGFSRLERFGISGERLSISQVDELFQALSELRVYKEVSIDSLLYPEEIMRAKAIRPDIAITGSGGPFSRAQTERGLSQ